MIINPFDPYEPMMGIIIQAPSDYQHTIGKKAIYNPNYAMLIEDEGEKYFVVEEEGLEAYEE